jgi:hypothetical protein
MENLSLELTPAMLVLVPMVAAVIQFIKKIPQLASYHEWLPLVSLALGVGAAYLQKLPDPIMAGIIIGLTASGAFDVLKGNKEKKVT